MDHQFSSKVNQGVGFGSRSSTAQQIFILVFAETAFLQTLGVKAKHCCSDTQTSLLTKHHVVHVESPSSSSANPGVSI